MKVQNDNGITVIVRNELARNARKPSKFNICPNRVTIKLESNAKFANTLIRLLSNRNSLVEVYNNKCNDLTNLDKLLVSPTTYRALRNDEIDNEAVDCIYGLIESKKTMEQAILLIESKLSDIEKDIRVICKNLGIVAPFDK